MMVDYYSSRAGYHSPSSQSLGTDMSHYIYALLNLTVPKQCNLSSSQRLLNYLAFQSFKLLAYLMKVIPETRT